MVESQIDSSQIFLLHFFFVSMCMLHMIWFFKGELILSNLSMFRYYEGLQKCLGLYSENPQYSSDQIEELDALYKSLRQLYNWSSAVKVIYYVLWCFHKDLQCLTLVKLIPVFSVRVWHCVLWLFLYFLHTSFFMWNFVSMPWWESPLVEKVFVQVLTEWFNFKSTHKHYFGCLLSTTREYHLIFYMVTNFEKQLTIISGLSSPRY